MITHAEYKVRPHHQRGESLAGYVYRFHSANGHRVPANMQKLVAALYDRQTIYEPPPYGGREDTFDRLQRLLGADCILDAAWWIDGDYPLRHIDGNGEALRLCPACIGWFGFHMAIWELPLVNACPIHGDYLIAQCPRCRRDLRWSRLLPDWNCRCGQDIPSMATAKAPAPSIQRSAMLVGAIDVQRPDAYPQDSLHVQAVPQQRLELVYRHFDRGYALRLAIVTALQRGQPETLRGIPLRAARTEPHRWEILLLRSWPKSFQEVLLRLARRCWRSTRATFVWVPKGSVVEEVIAHLGVSLSEGWVNDMMRRAAQQLIDNFKAPLTTRTLVFFNPRYEAKERDDRLMCFWNWWHKLCRMLSRRSGKETVMPPLGQPTREDLREAMAVGLLTRLVDAANDGADPHRYVGLFDTWRYAGESIHPVTLVRGLADALIALSYAHLAGLTLQLDALERTGAR